MTTAMSSCRFDSCFFFNSLLARREVEYCNHFGVLRESFSTISTAKMNGSKPNLAERNYVSMGTSRRYWNKTLIFYCILISRFWSVENLQNFNFAFLFFTAFCLRICSWHPLLLPLCVKWLHVLCMKMWKWNVNSVVLLY